MVDLPDTNENRTANDSDSFVEVAKSIEDFLQPKATEIIEERRRKSVEEKKREEEKAAKEAKVEDCRSKYKELVLQTRERLAEEADYCDSVFNSAIVPYLEKIRQFAEEKNIYPPTPSEKPLDLLPQLFKTPKTHDYRLSKDFEVPYYYTNEDDLEKRFKEQAEELDSLHSYIECGLEWGYKTSDRRWSSEDGWGNSYYSTDYFIATFGISMQISHNGEVTINDLLFSRSELSSSRFRQALSDAFYAPKQIRRIHISEDEYVVSSENGNEDEEEKPFHVRLKRRFIGILRNSATAWKKLWGTPENDTKPEDSFLRKLWYGFPTQEKTNQDENNSWGLD